MNEPVKREPAAQFRQAAAVWRQMYLALVDEGFSDQQSLVILGQVVAANMRPSSP